MQSLIFALVCFSSGLPGRRVELNSKQFHSGPSSRLSIPLAAAERLQSNGHGDGGHPLQVLARLLLRCHCAAGWRVASTGVARHSCGTRSAGPHMRVYDAGPRNGDGLLKVDEIHSIYWQEFGNSAGKPALFLHGGPGAGCNPRNAKFFDPAFYRIVLVDQRGCGGSTPLAELQDNDTPHLVSDLEALREHLKVTAWHVVLGGSWGSALALAYTQRHPSHVKSLVLRGVCCMRSQEIDWLFGDQGGARKVRPDDWLEFARPYVLEANIPALALDESEGFSFEKISKNLISSIESEVDKSKGKYHLKDRQALLAYYEEMLSANGKRQETAASRFTTWDMKLFAQRGQPNVTKQEFQIHVEKDQGGKLGVTFVPAGKTLVVLSVSDGVVSKWNSANPGMQVQGGNAIVEVNGVRGEAEELLTKINNETDLRLTISYTLEAAMVWNGTSWSTRDRMDHVLGQLSEAEVRQHVLSVDRFTNLQLKKWPKKWSQLQSSRWRRASEIARAHSARPPVQALLTCHYSVHNAFMDDDALFQGVKAIRSIPCIAVQGAADFVTPPATALDLLKVWPEMELRIVPDGGHSMDNPGISSQLVLATDRLKEMV